MQTMRILLVLLFSFFISLPAQAFISETIDVTGYHNCQTFNEYDKKFLDEILVLVNKQADLHNATIFFNHVDVFNPYDGNSKLDEFMVYTDEANSVADNYDLFDYYGVGILFIRPFKLYGTARIYTSPGFFEYCDYSYDGDFTQISTAAIEHMRKAGIREELIQKIQKECPNVDATFQHWSKHK
jgi:hypothetical protein